MHPFYSESIIRLHERELDRYGRTAHMLTRAPRTAPRPEPVTIRLARPQDEAALVQLALLDCRPRPDGAHVIAVVDGTVVAALPLAGGQPFGDPFRRTSHLVPLLELRAKQLTAIPPRRKPVALLGAIFGWGRV
jgi:hypothetical protein